jgi:hypothetical protein
MQARLDENGGGGGGAPVWAPHGWAALRTAVVSEPTRGPAKMLTMFDVVLKLRAEGRAV